MAYELNTKVNDADVKEFLDSIEDKQQREDSYRVMEIMREITGCEPKMWGKSIVGLDTYTYTYASGQTGDWMVAGFSPRKANLTLYVMNGFVDMDEKLSQLGKYKTGKSCLYIKRLSDVDENILREMIKDSVAWMKKTYP
jgi:hypothetical protein